MSKFYGFILAAGEGRRMRPATLTVPKALLPFCGVPLLELTTGAMSRLPELAGIVVNACYLGDQVAEACLSLDRRYDFPVRCSMEEKLLNHGGGIRKGILEAAPDAEEILVHNADIVHGYDLAELLAAHRADSRNAATLLLIPRPLGVTVNADGTIASFWDHAAPVSYTFSGVYVISREILDFLPPGQEAPSIIDAFRAAAAAGRRINAVIAGEECFWSDVGSAGEYICAHGSVAEMESTCPAYLREAAADMAEKRRCLERSGVKCTGVVAPSGNVQVAAGTELHNVVLWDGCTVAQPGFYCQGILQGRVEAGWLVPPYQRRQPDERIASSLGLQSGNIALEEFPRQASGRRYARIRMADGASRIWCAYTQERRENAAFAAVAECLRSIGVRTPAVIIHLPDAGEMLLEDLGGEDMLGMPRENLAAATEGLLGQIALLHARGAEAAEASNLPLQPPFNEALYQWEADYFRNELLANVLNAPRLWNEAVEAEWRRMMQTLLAEPLVTLHRDLQSANVKIRDGRTWLIDFQGIRLGAAAYDLASLLYDPYLERTPEERQNGWSAYCRAVTAAGKVPPADELFHAAAVQRLMQALGAYGKLWKKDGLEKFRTRITPALKNISAAVKCTSYRTLDAFFEEVARIWAAHPEYTDSGKFG